MVVVYPGSVETASRDEVKTEPLLMQLATLPADKQVEYLLNVPGGPYPNAFFYAVMTDINLLNNLLDSNMQYISEPLHQTSLHYCMIPSET